MRLYLAVLVKSSMADQTKDEEMPKPLSNVGLCKYAMLHNSAELSHITSISSVMRFSFRLHKLYPLYYICIDSPAVVSRGVGEYYIQRPVVNNDKRSMAPCHH